MGIGLQNSCYKIILFFFSFLLAFALQEGYGQTAGDIAVIGFNTDEGDDFAFVALENFSGNQDIYFSDADWDGSTLDRDGSIVFTTPSDGLSAGAVIIVEEPSAVSGNQSVNEGSVEKLNNYNLTNGGEELYVYLADEEETNPEDHPDTFLYAVTNKTSWDSAELDNTGLTNGLEALSNFGDSQNDNAQYLGTREGTKSNLLNNISEVVDYWETSDGSGDQSFSFDDTNFTLVDPPTIAFRSAQISGEEGTTVDIEVELVEANGSDVDVEVAFLENASTAKNGDDFASYSTTTVSFSAGDDSGTTKTISIDLTDDGYFEGSEKAVFKLQNISTGTLLDPIEKTVTIEDVNTPEIVINEIHADPADGTDGDADGNDERDPNDDEFVELVNNSSEDIDISGWTFFNENDLKHTFPDGTVIPANRALVLFGDDEVSPQGNYGGAIVQSTNESATLGLINTGQLIQLEDSKGNEVISIDYPEANNGQSLVRDPEITGDFKEHSDVDEAGDNLFSPGTKADGSAFGSQYAIGIRGSEGWRMMSSPTQNTTFEDLLGTLWMQGVPNSNDPSGELTLAQWSESDATFEVPSNMSDDMTPGKGYIVYVFEDDELNTPGIQGGFPKVLGTDETENNTVDVAVSATDADGENGIDGNEGWNLLGNPFGTDLSVSALLAKLEELDASANANIYVWDHADNGGNGNYVTLNDGDRIAPFQAFFVKFDAEVSETNFEFNKNDFEANTGAEFYKDNEGDGFSFDLRLHGEQYYDSYMLEFSKNGTVDLDRYDAYKLFSLNPESINLFSVHGNSRLQKNALPQELETAMEIPLSFDANGRKELTFRWEDDFEDIPSDWDLILIDTQEDREINIRTSQEYQFAVSSDDGEDASEKQTLLNKRNSSQENSRFILAVDPNLDEMESGEIPESVKLNPNYPNPFNPTTTIPYELAEDAEVKLTVWNMIGQKVATLVDGMVDAGSHEETWNASNMPSGIYIARFEVGGEVFTRKMTLIK
ncbi:MAG: lamin tail domain-containing protein [Bacteroidota bacterium]